MSSNFVWSNYQSRNFGLVSEPLVSVEVRGQSIKSEWRKFVFKVDSGAIITLMNKSDCETFGYQWDSGQYVELGMVEGNPIPAYVHRVSMRVGYDILENVRVAFSEKYIQQLLLGRLEVFYFFDINLKGRTGLTVFYH